MTAIKTGPSAPPTDSKGGGRSKWLVQVAGWTMIWLGGLVFAYLAFQLWGTGIYTAAAQDRLGQEVAQRFPSTPAQPSPTGIATPNSVRPEPAYEPPPVVPTLIPEEPPPEGRPWVGSGSRTPRSTA